MCCSPSPSQLEFMKTSVPHCFVRVSVASPLVGLAFTYLDLSKATQTGSLRHRMGFQFSGFQLPDFLKQRKMQQNSMCQITWLATTLVAPLGFVGCCFCGVVVRMTFCLCSLSWSVQAKHERIMEFFERWKPFVSDRNLYFLQPQKTLIIATDTLNFAAAQNLNFCSDGCP